MTDQATSTIDHVAAAEAFEKLWPLPKPEIVIVTGPINSGKSTLTLGTGAMPERTIVLDFEKSQKAFAEQIDFTYVDVQAKLAEKYPKGYKNIEMYSYIVDVVNHITPGRFDVIVLDNASVLEDAIVAYVEANPGVFGHSAGQYASMSSLKWGDVKNQYQQFLTSLASKAKMVFVVVHLRDKWVNNKIMKDAMGNVIQEPKGKETLEMLSSLFVWLEAGPEGIPSAKVLKSRIDKKIYVADPTNPPEGIPASALERLCGEPGLVTIPVLPMRIPRCEWPFIRQYMRNPANLQRPQPGEVLTAKEISEDDRLKMRSIIAQAQAETESMKLSQIQAGAQTTAPRTAPAQQTPPPPAAKPTTPVPGPQRNLIATENGFEEVPPAAEPKSVSTPVTPPEPEFESASDMNPEEIAALEKKQRSQMFSTLSAEYPSAIFKEDYKGADVAVWLKEAGFTGWDYQRFDEIMAVARRNVATIAANKPQF